jgi:hypothetical protein
MTDRSQWKRIEPVVRKVIHAWDPYRLLEGGAPGDEWDREILQIVARVGRIYSAADAAAVVSEVFTEAFHPEGFGQDELAEVGKKLFTALQDAGMIEAPEQAGGG